MSRKLIFAIIIIGCFLLFTGCSSTAKIRTVLEHSAALYPPPKDSIELVIAHKTDSVLMIAIKNDNERLKKENTKLKIALLAFIGLGGFGAIELWQ